MSVVQRVGAGVAALVLCALVAVVLYLGVFITTPTHGSPYDTGTGVSNLLAHNGIDDSHLRACDTRLDGMPFGAWSKDNQTGNIALTQDNSGANDGDCANKFLTRNHDKHGSGFNKDNANYDIRTGFYSGH